MRRKLIAAATAIALGITMTTTGAIAFGVKDMHPRSFAREKAGP